MAESALRQAAPVGDTLADWLDEHAEALDQGLLDPESLLPRLAQDGRFGLGVARELGGAGGSLGQAVEGIAGLAEHSLTAAFVCWGQRAFIEYLLQSPNTALRERLLPGLLRGELAGATGLSNAMKFLSGLEELQIEARRDGSGWRLNGRMPWVTNLRKTGFVVAGAVARQGEQRPFVAALPNRVAGLRRSADLQLLGLQSSNTAALDLIEVPLDEDWLLHGEAHRYLPRVRPAFLGLQCGLAIGLARRSLAEVRQVQGEGRRTLQDELEPLEARQLELEARLLQGLADERFIAQPAELFRLRIGLAEQAAAAVQLELQARGGGAYLRERGDAFSRRWREVAFVPIVTPSLTQLRGELARHAALEDGA
ncbi:acyl-CoA dehydrogenase family protein [Pseudomonas sp. EpS/L25]|uniref:acyl-CoA dehydrogenase family protein n=1 Tax=Pseudomonas sp. EpS/L25 TaxID=1749078 RepID=UPI0007434043|nr:acyl-CoA dehydrogenase family protein [Pseudomonas sp. EpS/L25]KUM42965.1 acyl-CoA dehydrogenase [Pseudomonas sp. EpS/L25]